MKQTEIIKEITTTLQKDRRVINIPKDDYNLLKAYCDENTLDMPKWMVKNSKEKIPEVNRGDDFLDLLAEDPAEKFKTYENISPEFRFSKEFVCRVLFPGIYEKTVKFEIEKKDKAHILKMEAIGSISCYAVERRNVDNDGLKFIQNAYKDICDKINMLIEYNKEDDTIWWVYALRAKDEKYYE